MHGGGAPSPWLLRWARLLPAGAGVLDVACGSGRHLAWLAAQGHRVTGVDRDAAALAALAAQCPQAERVLADIEAGPWPFAGRQFDLVLLTNYLWRPLAPALRAAVAPGGLLIHETFAAGNETVGRPARPEFLLQPGELLGLYPGLRAIAYEDGFLDAPPRFVQRLVAAAPAAEAGPPPRWPLAAAG